MSNVNVCSQMHAPDWEPKIGSPVRAEDVLALQDFVRHLVQYRLRRVFVLSFWGSDFANTSSNPSFAVPLHQYRSANNPSRVIIEAEPRFPYSQALFGAKDPPTQADQLASFDMIVTGYSGSVHVTSPDVWNDNLQDVMFFTEYPSDNRTNASNFTTSNFTFATSGNPYKIPGSMRIEWQPTTTGQVGT